MEISKKTTFDLYTTRRFNDPAEIMAFKSFIATEYPKKFMSYTYDIHKSRKIKNNIVFHTNKTFAYENTIFYLDFFEQYSKQNFTTDFTDTELVVLHSMLSAKDSHVNYLAKNIINKMPIGYAVYFILDSRFGRAYKEIHNLALTSNLLNDKYNRIQYEDILQKNDYLTESEQYRRFIEYLYPEKFKTVRKALIRTGNYNDRLIPYKS